MEDHEQRFGPLGRNHEKHTMSHSTQDFPSTRIFLALCLSVLLVTGVAVADDSAREPGRSAAKPNPLKNVYFGEQHLHSENSPDEFATGSRQKREDAFIYGRSVWAGR